MGHSVLPHDTHVLGGVLGLALGSAAAIGCEPGLEELVLLFLKKVKTNDVVMAYIVMANMAMAYIVLAFSYGLYSYGLHSHGLYSYDVVMAYIVMAYIVITI